MKNPEWIHDTEWHFFIKIGDNEYLKSDIIPRSKNIQTTRKKIWTEVHTFVNQLIKSAKEGTLDIPYPTPEPPRTTFPIEWELTIRNDNIEWYLEIPSTGLYRKTILDALIRVKKDIRGRV